MKIYVQKQIKTLYTPTNKKQSIQFNIIKQNEDKINHIHGQTVNNKGQMLKIRLKKYKIADFKAHIKNNSSFKLNSAEIYKIYDESIPEEERKKWIWANANLNEVVLDMAVKHLPNPVEAQKYRIPKIKKLKN